MIFSTQAAGTPQKAAKIATLATAASLTFSLTACTDDNNSETASLSNDSSSASQTASANGEQAGREALSSARSP